MKSPLPTKLARAGASIDELRAHVEQDPRFAGLADICEANSNVWNLEAERYLLAHWA